MKDRKKIKKGKQRSWLKAVQLKNISPTEESEFIDIKIWNWERI